MRSVGLALIIIGILAAGMVFARRAHHAPQTFATEDAVLQAARASRDKDERIAILISGLDTVKTVMSSNPGGVYYSMNPVVQALVKEGDEAVPPLIDALQSDQRYTQAFYPTRFSRETAKPVPVRSAAWGAIQEIWPSSMASSVSGEIPPFSALRERWSRVSGLSEPERWLEVLRDDSADQRAWIQAAKFLVKPSDETWLGHGSYVQSKDPNAPMTAEPLRARRGAEISALLQKRAMQLASGTLGSTLGSFAYGNALTLAHYLALWDRSRALATLRDTCSSAIQHSQPYGQGEGMDMTFARPLAIAYADRLSLGDQAAAGEYSDFLARLDPLQAFFDPRLLTPFWKAPESQQIREAQLRFFGVVEENLKSTDPKVSGQTVELVTQQLLSTPLLADKNYRQVLLTALQVDRPLGTTSIESRQGRVMPRYRVEGGMSGAWNVEPGQEKLLHDGDSSSFTVRDFTAERLAHGFVKGVPHFSILNSEAQRAAERAQMVQWLSDDQRDWIAVAKTSFLFDANLHD